MTYALLRQFSDDMSLLHQRAMVMGYARSRHWTIDKEMIEFGSSGKSLQEREQFDAFLHTLKEGDHLMVDEVHTLGRTIEEVLTVINCMLSRDVLLVLASIELIVDDQTSLSKILPWVMHLDVPSTESESHAKKGRPKGSRSASKFDVHLDQIISCLKAGESVSAISRKLDVRRSSLKDYIESRQLKKILDDAWVEKIHAQRRLISKGTAELICTLDRFAP